MFKLLTTDIYWNLLTSTETYWHLLKPTDIYWNLLTSTETYWHLLKPTDIYWNLLTSTNFYWHLLTFTLRMTIYQPILPMCWHWLSTVSFWLFRKYSAFFFGNIRLLSETFVCLRHLCRCGLQCCSIFALFKAPVALQDVLGKRRGFKVYLSLQTLSMEREFASL